MGSKHAIEMGEMGDRAHMRRLSTMFGSDASPTVRSAAHEALVKLAKGFDAGDAGAWRRWIEKNP